MTQFRDPDLTDRAYISATAYHAIKRYFAHAEGLPAGYDFEARYRAYLREALEAPDRRAFRLPQCVSSRACEMAIPHSGMKN